MRPLLFRLDPETAHRLTLYALRFAGNFAPTRLLLHLLYYAPAKPIHAFGLTFQNPIGLAAGYDKDGIAIRGLSALGFGHLEIGTVTPLPQAGAPRPRLFRLTEDEAVINRMGFPSRGAEIVSKQLAVISHPSRTVLGINLGKNKDTPNEQAVFDYLSLLQTFAPHADYLTINVSSPNTAGLRDLQARAALEALLSQLHAQRKLEEKRLEKHLPLLVKLSPDLSDAELDDALDVILRTGMDGVIATNTTLSREGLRSDRQLESGGLSGGPLGARSEALLGRVIKRVEGRVPIVSVGGIMNPEDARRRLDMGATLLQVYSGLVFHGPSLVRKGALKVC